MHTHTLLKRQKALTPTLHHNPHFMFLISFRSKSTHSFGIEFSLRLCLHHSWHKTIHSRFFLLCLFGFKLRVLLLDILCCSFIQELICKISCFNSRSVLNFSDNKIVVYLMKSRSVLSRKEIFFLSRISWNCACKFHFFHDRIPKKHFILLETIKCSVLISLFVFFGKKEKKFTTNSATHKSLILIVEVPEKIGEIRNTKDSVK